MSCNKDDNYINYHRVCAKCLKKEEPPISGDDCDNCRWFDERKEIKI